MSTFAKANYDATLQKFCRKLQERTAINIRYLTVGQIRQQLKLTSLIVQQAQLDYWVRTQAVDPKDLVFIDESGYQFGNNLAPCLSA